MGFWRNAWIVCVLLVVLGLGAASATAVFRSDAWIADLVESFRPHLLVAALAALPLALTLRGGWRGAALAASPPASSSTAPRSSGLCARRHPREARGGVGSSSSPSICSGATASTTDCATGCGRRHGHLVWEPHRAGRRSAGLDATSRIAGCPTDDIAILCGSLHHAQEAGIRVHGTLAMATLSLKRRRIDLMALHASVPTSPDRRIARRDVRRHRALRPAHARR